jgi:hypothetical protein
MFKKIIMPGLLGWIVLALWTFIVNGVFGFRSRIDMMRIPDERRVYEVLRESIVKPGRYVCNPALSASGTFPNEDPVFSVLYSGMGHGSAGMESLLHMVIGLCAMMAACWMLSVASPRILSSYPRKVLFFAAIGLLFALHADLASSGIGGYPLTHAIVLAAHSVIVWTLIGLVVAGCIKPDRAVKGEG